MAGGPDVAAVGPAQGRRSSRTWLPTCASGNKVFYAMLGLEKAILPSSLLEDNVSIGTRTFPDGQSPISGGKVPVHHAQIQSDWEGVRRWDRPPAVGPARAGGWGSARRAAPSLGARSIRIARKGHVGRLPDRCRATRCMSRLLTRGPRSRAHMPGTLGALCAELSQRNPQPTAIIT